MIPLRLAAALMPVALCAATGAAAATMTFDSLADEGEQLDSYVENGITATAIGGVLAWSTGPGSAHVDDSGTGFATGIDFTTGGLFDAAGFSLVSQGYNFFDPPEPFADNILVTGYQGASIAASATFLLSDIAGTLQSILLGSAFSGLTRLNISLLYPQTDALCDAPCGHFDLESVTLDPSGPAPVPLPAPGLLLIGGAGALVALRRRRTAGT